MDLVLYLLLFLSGTSAVFCQSSSRTEWLPENYPLPFLGNGYISTPVFGNSMYVSDLYNGQGPATTRVAIPSTVNVRIDRHPELAGSTVAYTFNAEQGFFETLVHTNQYWIRQRLYCHIRIPELVVMEIEARGKGNFNSQVAIPITRGGNYATGAQQLSTDSIAFEQQFLPFPGSSPYTKIYNYANGTVTPPNSDPELQNAIAIVWDGVPENIRLENSSSHVKAAFLTVIDRTQAAALEKFNAAKAAFVSGVLYSRHRDKWGLLFGTGRLNFEASDASGRAEKLQQAAFSSLYALLSAVPDHPDYIDRVLGVGPSNNDEHSDFPAGRHRWEQELHVFPPLLLLHPDSAAPLIQNRLRQLAKGTAAGYAGAKYPYETVTGSELWRRSTSRDEPDFSRALYVSGAVAFALQQYVSSGLTGWRDPYGRNLTAFDAALEIAEFYQGLLTRNPSSGVTKTEQTVVGINPHAVKSSTNPGPEKYYVYNHAVTHAVASVALRLPRVLFNQIKGEVAGQGILDLEMFDEFERLADTMYFPTAVSEGVTWHPAAETTSSGTPITEQQSCEPDLLLAYFPLRHPHFTQQATCETINEDLQRHAPKTGTCSGIKPTYVTTRHTVHLLAQRADKCTASQLSSTSDMLSALEGDFHIIPEYLQRRPSPVSLAGHGSLLQGLLSGYGGIELQPDRLVIDPIIPPGTKSWTITGLDYHGFVLNLHFAETETRVKVVKHARDATLFVEGENSVAKTPVKHDIMVKRARIFLTVHANADYHWSKIPFKFESHWLPEQKYMPEVGNGHIATIVNGPVVFMNGLFNGEGPKSSRAKIPSLVGFQVVTNHTKMQLVSESYTLDVRRGTFKEVKVYIQPPLMVEREVFAHRDNDRLLISRVTITPKSGPTSSPVDIRILGLPDTTQFNTSDIAFQPTTSLVISGLECKLALGETRIPEVPGVTKVSPVAVAFRTADLQNITVNHSPVTMTAYVAIGVDADEAVHALTSALGMSYETLLQRHSAKWNSYFDNGFIHVDSKENFQLAQAIYGSFYYLLTSLPNKQDPKNRFIGLSPGGLARGADNGDYSGHIFWDTETWMYPSILNFHPDQARVLIETRTGTLEAAKQNAIKYGFKGAKFAWESAFSGEETSPWPPSGEYEIHISADIAFAVRQFLYVTDDKLRVIRELKLDEMAVEMARFWQSRVVCDGTPVKNCSLRDVMPPDEYHFPVENSVYTNYVVKLALELPAYVLNITGATDPDLPQWAQTARLLPLPEAVTADGKKYHLEFDGFQPGVWNPKSNVDVAEIKQGDVILLGYPLGMEMTPQMRETDLDVYLPITDEKGPAMTWGMFAVGHLELGNTAQATTFFEKNYENIVQPFGVWSEVSEGEGALNFLTGMGGFLQAIVNGYAGIRLMEDRVTLHPQRLPNTSHWKLVGYRHLGYQMDISFDFYRDEMTFQTRAKDSATHLVLALDSGKVYSLAEVGRRVTVPLGKGAMRQYNADLDVLPTVGPTTTIMPPSSGDSVMACSFVILFVQLIFLYFYAGI